MKKALISLFFLFMAIRTLSQVATNHLINYNNNKIKIEEFKLAINKQFTKITTGTSFSGLGNFASVSSDSKSFSIGGNFLTNESLWGFEISGGATEGIFRLFNNEELNSNFSGELKYHKLIKTNFAARNSFEVSEVENQIIEVNNQFKKDSLALSMQKDFYKIKLDILNSQSKIIEMSKQIDKINSELDVKLISSKSKDSLEVTKGFLSFEIESHKQNLDNWNKQLNIIQKGKDDFFAEELEKKAQIRDKKLIELKNKKQNIDLQGFDITWISFGLRAKNNEIKLYKPNDLTTTQIKDTSFVSQRFSASISRYRSTSFQNQDVYWSTGIFLDYTTNLNSLKKIEIEERIPVTGNPQQEIKKTINAYQGDYKEELFEFTMFYDYYRFFGKYNSIFGLHVNPSLNYNEFTKKPLTNLFLGIIVPFGDKEKQSSKINVEVFYNRQDIFNYLHKEVNISSFGIRATLPITIINKKL